MSRLLLSTLATITFATVLTVSSGQAQTTSAGPYYAAPSWDQKLQCDTPSACPRFIVLSNWNNAAVLDRETGLVWERSPLAPCTDPRLCVVLDPGTRTWFEAQNHCNTEVTIGNRLGWRLPTVQELASLLDKTQSPPLPAGHPFIGVQVVAGAGSDYWTATTDASDSTRAWVVNFGTFASGPRNGGGKVGSTNVWCVRSGQPGSDPQ